MVLGDPFPLILLELNPVWLLRVKPLPQGPHPPHWGSSSVEADLLLSTLWRVRHAGGAVSARVADGVSSLLQTRPLHLKRQFLGIRLWGRRYSRRRPSARRVAQPVTTFSWSTRDARNSQVFLAFVIRRCAKTSVEGFRWRLFTWIWFWAAKKFWLVDLRSFCAVITEILWNCAGFLQEAYTNVWFSTTVSCTTNGLNTREPPMHNCLFKYTYVRYHVKMT